MVKPAGRKGQCVGWEGQCGVGSGGGEWDSLQDGVEGQCVGRVLVVMSGGQPEGRC